MLQRAALSWWQCASRSLCHQANAARRSPQLSSTLGRTPGSRGSHALRIHFSYRASSSQAAWRATGAVAAGSTRLGIVGIPAAARQQPAPGGANGQLPKRYAGNHRCPGRPASHSVCRACRRSSSCALRRPSPRRQSECTPRRVSRSGSASQNRAMVQGWGWFSPAPFRGAA